ncbi:MAG: PEP-CTERM sorting domain-containing protein [Pirellulales bacterium]
MKTRRLYRLTYLCVSVFLVGAMLCGGNAAIADPILPGFDYFFTPPGGAVVDLGSGPIPLEGVPLPNMALGLTDTVVARMDPGPPEGGTGIIDIELVALHLKSVVPIDPDGIGPAPIGDLHITIDASDRFFTSGAGGTTPHPDGTGTGPSFFDLPVLPSPPSIGNMAMMHGGPGPHPGADMKACFGDPAGCAAMPSGFGAGLGVPGGGIFATAILVVPGGDPADPSAVLGIMPAPPATLASMGSYLHTLMLPDEYGGIILAAVTHDGPHPHAQPVPDSIDRNVVPEPSTGLLVFITLLGVCAAGRARQQHTT